MLAHRRLSVQIRIIRLCNLKRNALLSAGRKPCHNVARLLVIQCHQITPITLQRRVEELIHLNGQLWPFVINVIRIQRRHTARTNWPDHRNRLERLLLSDSHLAGKYHNVRKTMLDHRAMYAMLSADHSVRTEGVPARFGLRRIECLYNGLSGWLVSVDVQVLANHGNNQRKEVPA